MNLKKKKNLFELTHLHCDDVALTEKSKRKIKYVRKRGGGPPGFHASVSAGRERHTLTIMDRLIDHDEDFKYHHEAQKRR